MRYSLLVITLFFVRLPVSAQAIMTSNQYDEKWQADLEHLTQQLGWQTPKLKEGDYEVRVWHRYGLVKGAAHGAYIIRKTGEKVSIDGYRIHYPENGRPGAKHYQPKTSMSLAVWDKLVDKHLLTLPTLADAQARYYASFPKDSTWTEISPDGTITVKARRHQPKAIFSDGEDYGISIFGHNNVRFYSYGNPFSSYRMVPGIQELRDMIDILNELNSLF